MTPPNVRIVENRKYLWDGETYRDEAEAARVADSYRAARFDVEVVAEGGEWFLFTRREAAAADAARG